MYKCILAVLIIVSISAVPTPVCAQAENVPASHPVYDFLRRMEVQRVLPQYHGTVIPLSREKVGEYVAKVYERSDRLSSTDRDLAAVYFVEFAFDIDGRLRRTSTLFSGDSSEEGPRGIFTNRQKYLYAWHDTSGNSMFVDGVVSYEHRSRYSNGDIAHGRSRPSLNLVDLGGRVRGTLGGRFGYYLKGANMMVKGDRQFALEDNRIVHSHSYRRSREDFAEYSSAYVRYDAGIAGIQLGRERVQWRESLGESLFLSSNAPLFNFLRIDLSYGAVNYNYIHGTVLFHNYRQVEENKYFVANRFEFSLFDNRLQMALNQTTMYSRSVPEIGYLIPFNILEATERNLGDRDASMIGFDMALRPVRNFEIKTGMLFDDIHFDKSFTGKWRNMWSVHLGFIYTHLFGIPDVDLTANYTRIEPHVYSHYTDPFVHHEHDGFLLGHPLGPNSDEWYAALTYRPGWQWRVSFEFFRQRQGDNIVDEDGTVIRNVGGDIYFPWRRGIDPEEKKFLDGILTQQHTMRLKVKYEIFRQFIVGVRAEWSDITREEQSWQHITLSGGIWLGM